MTMSFDVLPPEMHLAICECLPRETKTSFVLLNRHFHELCNPLLYRVLFLPTRRRVLDLQRTLHERPELASHVRHVLFSDRNREDLHPVLPDFVIYWPSTHSERLTRRQKIRDWLQERDKELSAFRAALRQITAVISPQLVSLTLLHYEHSIRSLSHLLTFSFPKLKELTIRGDYPPLPTSMHIPSLERLHLAAGDMPNPWASFSTLAEGCQNLQYVRVTDPMSSIFLGSVLADALELSLGVTDTYDPEYLGMPCERRSDGTFHPPSRPRLPSSLKELQVQPYPPDVTSAGIPLPDHVKLWDRLVSLEKQVTTFKLISPDGDDIKIPYSFQTAYADWQDRMAGGSGCWGRGR